MPTMQLTSPADAILLTGDDIGGKWIYDNDSMSSWLKLADVEVKLSARPNAHGAYDIDQLYVNEHRTTIDGQYFGTSTVDAATARNRLVAMFNDGRPIMLIVTDELGTTFRTVTLIDHSAPWKLDSHFEFSVTFVAPDPRRYGAAQIDEEGMPVGSSGLVWNLGTAPSGLYFDWGTVGTLGQVEFANTGTAPSSPLLEVGGAGGFNAGFRVTETETGRELTIAYQTGLGDIVRLNSRTGRATLNGADITRFMTSRKWFTVPSGATRHYQITPLAGYTGSPTIKITGSPANL